MLQLHSTTVLRHFRLSVCHALLLGEKAKATVTQSTVAGQVVDMPTSQIAEVLTVEICVNREFILSDNRVSISLVIHGLC